jgi:serine/threonine protein kinase
VPFYGCPHELLYRSWGVLQVADFGKSRLLNPDGVAKAGSYATITHMSPEYIQDRRLSPAADVYAFGVLLWQMFTCSRPWAGLSHVQIMGVVLAGEPALRWDVHPATPAAQRRDLVPGLVWLGAACLAHDPAARPGMTDIKRALDALAQC